MKEKDLHITNLISAYLSGDITPEAAEELKGWISESQENEKEFIRYLTLYKKARKIGFEQQLNQEKAWNNIAAMTKESGEKSGKVLKLSTKFNLLKYAAIFVGIIGLSYFFYSKMNIDSTHEFLSDPQITLELSNGAVEVIEENVEKVVVEHQGKPLGVQKGDLISYENEDKAETLAYNKLSVPYGKTFKLELSDGTKVVLNAGSTLKYPVQFVEGKSRSVHLEGEALFEVTRNEKDAFIVNAAHLNTQVFGTVFNVSSYANDPLSEVVLVEGKVGVYQGDTGFNEAEDSYMAPGQLATIENGKGSAITIKEVAVEEYIAWVDGIMYFRNEQFSRIIKKLERHYNIQIENEYTDLNEERFTAKFDVENIENALNAFKKIEDFNYKFSNNKIIITP